MVFVQSLGALTQCLARAGGGGSGSGGGGGGIILLGYVPMHFVGAVIRRRRQKQPVVFDLLRIGGWLLTVAYVLLLVVGLRGVGALAALGAPLGMGAGLYGWFGKLKQSKQTKVALQAAATQDGAWDESVLRARVAEVFSRFQRDWSNGDAEAMKAYLTPQYQYHNALMLYALQLAGRRNVVNNPTLTQSMVVHVQDEANDNEDTVVVGIEAAARDQLIETATQSVIFTDNAPFTEYWRFRRAGDSWLLDGIEPATASRWMANAPLEQFARSNGYYYSLDWGWLLLPRRGQLFDGAKFGTSDVNNHVIGLYNQQLLVQLYTYVPKPKSNGTAYLVAQANLPRSYGDIVVRRRHKLLRFGIHGLREVSTEWPDFNKKYQVLATSPEQATSLELLNPHYMEQLEAAPFEVNIEVVDNVVYLYAPEGAVVQPEHYQVMLGLLQAAFKEMRL